MAGDATVSAGRLEGTSEVPVSATLEGSHIVLGEPLVEGARYVVRGTIACEAGGSSMASTEFTVGPAATLPTELGALTTADLGVGRVSAITYLGSCSLGVDADRTEVTLTHATSTDPWRDALIYETWVDGARWRPSGSLGGALGPRSGSWVGRGVDVLYAICFETDLIEPEGLEEGEHAVELRARVAGESAVLSSSGATVTLDCTGYEAPDGGGVGYVLPDAGSTELDAGLSDLDAGSSELEAGPSSPPSMGCAAGARGGGGGWMVALILLALMRGRRA